MITDREWESPSSGILIFGASALLLTALGEWSAIRFTSTYLAFATVIWYGLVFGVFAWYRLPLALVGLVFALPLITVEVGLGDVEKTLSADKVALATVVLVWLARRLPVVWPRLWRVPSVQWWIIFLLIVLTSALRNGVTTSEAWSFLKQIVYACLFLLALDTLGAGQRFLRWMLIAAGLAGTIVAFLALVEGASWKFGHPLPLYFKQGTMMNTVVAGSTISHVNFLGGYFLLILPVVLVVSFSAGVRVRACLISCGIIVVVALLYARSMGASVGLLVASLLAVGLATSGSLPRAEWRGSIYAFVAIVMIAAAIIIPKSRVTSTPLATRLATYRIGLAAIAERPILGFGANGFPNQSLRLERNIFGHERAELHNVGVPLAAHSSFVDVAVERGLLGLAAVAGLLASILGGGIKAYLRSENLDVRVLLLGLIVGMVGFITQAFTENLFSYSKVAAIFWILSAAVVRLSAPGESG